MVYADGMMVVTRPYSAAVAALDPSRWSP